MFRSLSFTISLLVLSTSFCFSQNADDFIELTKGSPCDNNFLGAIKGISEDGIYLTYSNTRTRDELLFFDNNLNFKKSEKVHVKIGMAVEQIWDYAFIDNQPYLIYSSDTKGKRELFSKKITKKTLRLGAETKMESYEKGGVIRAQGGKYFMSPNHDSTQLIVVYDYPDNLKGEQLMISRFDSKLNKLWENEVLVPKETRFKVVDVKVNQNNQIYVLATINSKLNMNSYIKTIDPTIYIYKFSETGEFIQKFETELDGYWLTQYDFFFPKGSNNCILTGLYSKTVSDFWVEKPTSNSIPLSAMGSFFISIDDEENKIIHQSLNPFDADFVCNGIGDSEEKKCLKRSEKGKKSTFYSAIFSDGIYKESGGVILAFEESIPIHKSEVKNICFVSMNHKGEVEWTKKVLLPGASYLSRTKILEQNGNLYVFYKDKKTVKVLILDNNFSTSNEMEVCSKKEDHVDLKLFKFAYRKSDEVLLFYGKEKGKFFLIEAKLK